MLFAKVSVLICRVERVKVNIWAVIPGRGPLMWMMPLYLHVNHKSDDDDDVTAGFKHL